MSDTYAERFFQRFAGLTRAHGRYAVGPQLVSNEKGKQEGPRGTRPNEPLTLDLWSQHLAGRIGLGVVPIRDDNTVLFGAIDIDIYPLDLETLRRTIISYNMPLIVTRTKSGGAHLYIFFTEPCPAELAHATLAGWAAALGYPGVEVFPKQTEQGGDRTGNWINMPYAGGERTNRYGIGPDGAPLSMDAYLELAEHLATPPDELAAYQLPQTSALWEEAPPCLQTLSRLGFNEGSRGRGLFNVAVYLKKRYGESWQNLAAYNAQYFKPPLPPRDVHSTAKSVEKKAYNYKCKDAPIQPFCNRKLCLTRRYGVGGSPNTETGLALGELQKVLTQPITWSWNINGLWLEFATGDLLDQRRFQNKCVEALSVVPALLKGVQWQALIAAAVTNATEIDAPSDAGREGQFRNHLSDFCTSNVRGKALDEILMGKPFTENGRTNFRSGDFLQYLQQHRVTANERDIWNWLRRAGGENHQKVLKGKPVQYWSTPAFQGQTEDFSVPRAPQQEAM